MLLGVWNSEIELFDWCKSEVKNSSQLLVPEAQYIGVFLSAINMPHFP